MRLLVTGTQGQVVSALRKLAPAEGVEVVAVGRPDLDLAAPAGFGALLDRVRPDIVISAAAYTAVDLAENEEPLATAINGEAPGLMATACAVRDLPILHLSTDFVFDGTKPIPYCEEDAPNPLSAYGRSKRLGELAVAGNNPRHLILRTAWVYAAGGKNFVNTMLRLAAERDEVRVVADQFGCPTHADDIARAILSLSAQCVDARAADPRFGLYHMAGGGDTSWAGFAEAIFALAQKRGLPLARVIPILTEQYPLPAKRPANSRLDGRRLQQTFGIKLPHWSDSLARCLGALHPVE